MKKAFYRTRQWIFSLFVGVAQNKKTELINRRGSLLELPSFLVNKNISSVLVVTTKGFIKRNTLVPFFDELKKNNIVYTVYTDVNPDPSVACVEDGVKVYLENKCEGILAIGGGSVLDCAKIIGARVSNPSTSVRKMKGMLKIKKKLPLYIPVPTTCGTGSEVTAAAVISDEIDGKHYKYAITDLKLIPSYAYLDASLLDTLPPFMLSTTTMDALTHALEAYVNLYASKEVEKDALEATKLIFDNFELAYVKRDEKAIENLLFASTKAGIAFTHNFVGYVHALAHAMGAMYGLAHGYLNAIILPVVLETYGSKIEKKMEKLTAYLNVECEDSLHYVLTKINEMKEIASLPSVIKELRKEDFEEIIKRALKEANPTYPVPVIFFEKELTSVLNKLMDNSSKENVEGGL